jgi:tetratricopeptide (TPR) repeat protein
MGILTANQAKLFLEDHSGQTLPDLPRFLSDLRDYAFPLDTVSTKLDRDYRRLPHPEVTVLPIAACQIVGVDVPLRVIKRLDPSFDFAYNAVVQQAYDSNSNAYDSVCVMRSARTAKWILRTKFYIVRFESLRPVYETLIRTVVAERLAQTPAQKKFVPDLLWALARGVGDDVLTGPSCLVASSLVHDISDVIVQYFKEVVLRDDDVSELIYWGRALKAINAWQLAEQAYRRAHSLLGWNLNQADRGDVFRLIHGLRSLPGREAQLEALSLIEAEFANIPITEPSSRRTRCQLFTTWCTVLSLVDQTEKALQMWESYLTAESIQPDALLYMTIGSLYQANGQMDKAQASFDAGVRSVEYGHSRQSQVLYCLRTYAVFLALYGRNEWPRPVTYFLRARRYADTHDLPWESVVEAWAEHQIRIGWLHHAYRHLLRIVRSSRQRGVIYSRAWINLATLLSKSR